jgi:hypothetical protein
MFRDEKRFKSRFQRLIERSGKECRSSASQQMPDAVLACVASFAVSENTSVSRRGAALFRVKFNFLNQSFQIISLELV